MKRAGLPGPSAAASPWRFWRLAYLGALAAASLALVWLAGRALLPLAFAAVLAYVLAPPVAWLEHRRIHRVVGILITYTLVAFGLAAGALYVIPLAARQAGALARRLPRLVADSQAAWNRYLALFHQAPLPSALRGAVDRVGSRLDASVLHVLGSTLAAAVALVPWLVALIISPVLAFYVLKDWHTVQKRVWSVVPLEWQPAAFKLGRDLDRALAGYIRGQLLVAVLVGLLAGLMTFALGIPFPVLVGLAAAATDVVPYIGPVVGALPAVALGLLHSPWTALYAALGFIAIHQLEGTVLAPQVVGEAVGLHPLAVVVAVLVGAALAGLPGMLVAVPAAATVRIVGEHVYRWLAEGRPEP